MTPVEWQVTEGLSAYPEAVAAMEARVAAIARADAPERIWLVEHPPLYTAGTSADPADLLAPGRFPLYQTGRGGQLTYHGPGQRVAYVMLRLAARGNDLRRFVIDLDEWIIRSLARFGVAGERRPGRIGIWVARPGREDKIAALGIRVRRGVTYHGIAINLDPTIEHFSGIVPCGVRSAPDLPLGVTSLAALGVTASMAELDVALRESFEAVFDRKTVVPSRQAAQPEHRAS